MAHSLRENLRIVNPQKSRYFRAKILGWHKNNKRSFPWRKTKNPYYILIAEILLQQTDAAKVAKEYSSFIKTFPKPKKLAAASKSSVRRFISKLGLDYRVNRLISLASELEKKFNGKVPETQEKLLKLTGIGPYISNAVLASAYNKRAAVLDTNIVRILDRFFGIKSSKPRPRTDPMLWLVAHQLLPQKTNMCKTWNYALLDFAALVCTHYHPNCDLCTLRRCCNFLSKMCSN